MLYDTLKSGAKQNLDSVCDEKTPKYVLQSKIYDSVCQVEIEFVLKSKNYNVVWQVEMKSKAILIFVL